MLSGEKIPITGATGKAAFPVARALAGHNEGWGMARLRGPGIGTSRHRPDLITLAGPRYRMVLRPPAGCRETLAWIRN